MEITWKRWSVVAEKKDGGDGMYTNWKVKKGKVLGNTHYAFVALQQTR